MSKVTIHTTPACPYCIAAKALCSRQGHVTEISIKAAAAALAEPTGRRTVPQILSGKRISAAETSNLHALEAAGQLDELLERSAYAMRVTMHEVP